MPLSQPATSRNRRSILSFSAPLAGVSVGQFGYRRGGDASPESSAPAHPGPLSPWTVWGRA